MGAELVLRSRSGLATEAFGRLLGECAEAGLVVALEGDMGTGKTTLVRGMGVGLEIEEGVCSPTYTLMQAYQGRLELFHFDAWMEGREAAFLDGGGAEWFLAGGVAVVEWASRVLEYLPLDRLEIALQHTAAPVFDEEGMLDPDQDRGISLVAAGPVSESVLAGLMVRIEESPDLGLDRI